MEIPKGQKKRVLMYLERFGSITPLEAFREFGIMRLAAVIFKLRKEYAIATVKEYSVNRFGEKVGFARYFLETEGGKKDE